jgi:two-component system, NtrC family, sensor kinase
MTANDELVQKMQSMQSEVRVLLVDDEAPFRRNIARLLSARHIETLEAENGEACLSILQATSVHVVILDVQMPGMKGLEVLRRIKEKHPGTEVIMLTGQATTRDGVEGIKSGAFDYLSKPVEIDHLVGKILQAHEKMQMEEAHRRETEFREKMEKKMVATERLASLGTLAAGVAHEINNPLSIIKQSVKWLSLRIENNQNSTGPTREEIEKTLKHIDTAVERARRITHQLLGSARKAENRSAEIDLDKLTDDAVHLVARAASDAGIGIERKLDPRLRTVWSNPDGVRQVLTNLLLNAVHATEKGGTVTISTEQDGGDFILCVTDTGVGIPEENLERIFEPFFTTKPAGEGTGLGLYVTRSILDSLGGTITVESRVGRGTRVCVRLPKAPKNNNPIT